MAIVFPTESELGELFGFVTDEDRKRWQTEPKPAPQKHQKKFSNMSQKLDSSGERMAQEQRMAAQTDRAKSAPKVKTTRTTTTEHVREDEDLSY